MGPLHNISLFLMRKSICKKKKKAEVLQIHLQKIKKIKVLQIHLQKKSATIIADTLG